LKNGFFVILNKVKDLELINMTRFFASLRMTNFQLWQFFNSLIARGLALTRPGWPGKVADIAFNGGCVKIPGKKPEVAAVRRQVNQ
jgi:hypothetical protein